MAAPADSVIYLRSRVGFPGNRRGPSAGAKADARPAAAGPAAGAEAPRAGVEAAGRCGRKGLHIPGPSPRPERPAAAF